MDGLLATVEGFWDPGHYAFWLVACSLLVAALERLFPWRRGQRLLRPELGQDLFFLLFNGHFFGLALAQLATWVLAQMYRPLDAWGLPHPEQLALLAGAPFWLRLVVLFLLKDLLEWCVHNLLHRVSWLWTFHQLHHSIETMDFIGNLRFHWMEIVVYRSLTWLPLTLLGVGWDVGLPIAVCATLIGHLNHSNMRLSYGPLRYLLNSPRMHLWHHDEHLHLPAGQNFGIVFSVWDWMFGTAVWPADKESPRRLGFEGLARFPRDLGRRLLWPLLKPGP